MALNVELTQRLIINMRVCNNKNIKVFEKVLLNTTVQFKLDSLKSFIMFGLLLSLTNGVA